MLYFLGEKASKLLFLRLFSIIVLMLPPFPTYLHAGIFAF